jgi:hypothetical protein
MAFPHFLPFISRFFSRNGFTAFFAVSIPGFDRFANQAKRQSCLSLCLRKTYTL